MRGVAVYHLEILATPYEVLVSRLAELLGEATARSAVNTFCKQTVGVAPTALTASQLSIVLPSFRPMLSILIGSSKSDLVLKNITQELNR